MGSAWEVSGALATVCSTLDLGTSDPVTANLIWVLTMLASNFYFFSKLCFMQTRQRKLSSGGREGGLLQHLQSQAALNLPELSGTA